MKLTGIILLGGALCLGGIAIAQDTTTTTTSHTSAKQDMKDAGHETKEKAAKDTGRATKKTTKKVVHKSAQKTDEGAQRSKTRRLRSNSR